MFAFSAAEMEMKGKLLFVAMSTVKLTDDVGEEWEKSLFRIIRDFV